MTAGKKHDMKPESGIRILLVDDSPDQRTKMKSLLAEASMEVVEAESGEAALALLKAGDFAVVLIDIRMPGMNGFELAEHIRALEPVRKIPIMFLTATQAPDAHIRRGYALGAVDFLITPVIPEAIRAKMEFFTDYFQRRRMQTLQSEALEKKVSDRTAELRLRIAVTRTLTDNAASGLFMLDGDRRITFMNPAAEQGLGHTFADVRGRTFHQIAHPAGPGGRPCAGSECLLEKALEADFPMRNLSEVFFHKGGRALSVSCSISPLQPIGESIGTVVEVRDVTEHKHAEDRLRRSEDRYRRLFETAQDGILILEAKEGHILDVNPFLARLLGYAKEELLGKELWEIGLFKDIEANQDAFLTLQRDGYVRYDNLPLQTKDGRRREVEFVSNVYPVGGEAVIQCNIRDITERKQIEASLRRAESDLLQSQKVEALGKLSGGIAHDFNNLLTAINGYADLCLSFAGSDGPLREYLDKILKAGQRAAELTHQLLAFSRKQVLAPKVFDLSSVVGEVTALMGRVIGDGIRLTEQLEQHLWLVRADPNQIHQVLMNLTVNARDAIPQGGEITIRTQNVGFQDADGAKKTSHSPLQYVLLSVSDTGMGMNNEVKSHIFDPFYTTKGFGKGSGMGLATVDGIVRQSGGHITVESSPGHGSTFRIFLPRAEGPEDPIPAQVSLDSQGLRGTETILLAEDDETVRTFARNALELHGYTVLEAKNGDEVVKAGLRHRNSIDLLLTDLLMPGMSGRELAARFNAVCPQAHILFMSGYTDELIADQSLLEEGAMFIRKPFSPAHLIGTIRGIFTEKSRIREDAPPVPEPLER